MHPRPRQPLVVVLGVLAPLLLVLGIWLGGHPERLPVPVRDALVGDSDAQTVDRAIDEVHGQYYRPIPRGALVDAALSGIVRSLHDRFSSYFTARQYRDFQENTDAEFSGVGLTAREDPRGLLVDEVFDHSPAKRAGIRSGDVIVGVNGRSLRGKSGDRSRSLIKGRPGTVVRLTILSRGHRRTEAVQRATVSVPVVASHIGRLADGRRYADVALAQFSSGAHGELREAIDRRLKEGAKGIVLDLRGNGGGLVEEARLVASIFIAEGPIVSTRGRAQRPRTLMAAGGAIAKSVPVVVLVDGDTASAAEIVAGALQDRHRAEVVGRHTFGKGVFQEVTTLPNGGALDLTVGQYFTPSGRNLGGAGVKRGSGIKPDVPAGDDPHTPRYDEALAVAKRVLARER
ncbi:MAG TPA: S41 family peptidase [Solirubrobacteraceae bacterium]